MRDIDVIDVLRQVISFTTVCIYVYAVFACVSVDVVCILVVTSAPLHCRMTQQ